METSSAVCLGHVSLLVQYYTTIVVVTDAVLKYFVEYSTTFVAKYQRASDVLLYTWRLLA